MTRPRWTVALAAALLLAGCGDESPDDIPWRAFDGRRAHAHVQRLVSYGPRPAGSHGLIRSATYIATQLQEVGVDTEEQVFIAQTPHGPTQFRNVIGTTRRQNPKEPLLLVAGHYDTKHLTNTTFLGANDGGSSAGALLELARVASGQANIWFVFFDGEEAQVEYSDNDGLHGSKYFIEDLKGKQLIPRVKALLLLDMVGDAQLNVTLPSNSHPTLVQKLFDAARDTGFRDYFSLGHRPILDDHVPFQQAGIPALDIIDFDFGSVPGQNDYWHTGADTLDKVSPRSLEIVGQTTLRLLALLKKTPKL